MIAAKCTTYEFFYERMVLLNNGRKLRVFVKVAMFSLLFAI